jgi:cell cycle sensor histidine kinase DivJ
LSFAVSSFTGLGAGVASGSQHFVSDRAPIQERPVQGRFAISFLMGPFVLASVWIVAAATGFPVQVSVATLLVLFVSAWTSVALVNWSGRLWPVAAGMLGVTAGMLAWTVAASGGYSSPVLLLALAIAPEAWWIMRTRRSLVWGAGATLAVFAAIPLLQAAANLPALAFEAWHWLIPATYLMAFGPRLVAAICDEAVKNSTDDRLSIDDVVDAAILRFKGAGDIIDAGGKSEDLFAVSAPLLLGNGLFDRIHVGDRVAYLHTLSGIMEGQTRRCQIRVRMPSDASGNVFYRPLSVEAHGGSPGFMVLRDDCIVQDLHQAIGDLKDQLAEGEIAKARFLATVSHELRTPLNAIIGFSDMMTYGLAGEFADPRQAEYTRIIRDSGRHLLAVVNAILDISRIESRAYSINCEPFRFAEAASACHEMLIMQAREKAIELRNDVSPSIGEIDADRRAVQQVLINLMSNAVKFTPQGGTVCLTARKTENHLVIDVSDTGIGIDANDLERLGRPFVQLRSDYAREQDGVGLGLSIAKGLVALHGGAMAISSAPGAGTTVTVTLPLKGPAVVPFDGQNSGEEGYPDAAYRKSA